MEKVWGMAHFNTSKLFKENRGYHTQFSKLATVFMKLKYLGPPAHNINHLTQILDTNYI